MTFEILKELAAQTSVATVTDVLDPKPNQFTILGLTPTQRDKQMFGQAVTLRSLPARPDAIADVQKRHSDKVASGDPMMVAIKLCGPGKILVVDSSGHPDAAIGGDTKFAAFSAQGAAGLVTDGALRDQREFQEIFEFPAFVSGFTPLVGTGRVLFGNDVNIDINCGGALVRPGDYLLGDEDGIVVIPEAHIEKTLNAAIASEKLGLYIREKAVRDGLTYGDIAPKKDEWFEDFLAGANLTEAQRATL